MSFIFLSLYSFFKKHNVVFYILLAGISAVLVYFASLVRFEEDITRFIPQDKNDKNFNFIVNNLSFSNKLIFSVSQKDTSQPADPDLLSAYADELTDSMNQKFPGYIKEIQGKLSDETFFELYNIIYDNLPLFLDKSDYDSIKARLSKESVSQALEKDYSTLMSPAGMVTKRFIIQDPLGIAFFGVNKLKSLQFDNGIENRNGYLFTKDQKSILLFVIPSFPANETKHNGEFINGIDGLIASLSQKEDYSGKIKTEYFGTTPVSVGNASQLKKDSLLTMIIALVLIIILIRWFYRSTRIIFFIILPLLFGTAFALAVIYFIKGEISTIAMGAGSVIIGIAINYSMHVFTHYKHKLSAETVIKDLTPPMTIGSITTIGAFFCLTFVNSRALQDFGLFSGLSLIGTVLFSLIALPQFLEMNRKQSEKIVTEDSLIEKISRYHFDRNRWIVMGVVVLTLVFLFFSGRVQFESDMTRMSYMSDDLAQAEKNIMEKVDFSSGNNLYLVSVGKNTDESLNNAAKLNIILDSLKDAKKIRYYSTVCPLMVSDSMKLEKIRRWNNFWSAERKKETQETLKKEGFEYKFRDNAFSKFYLLLDKDFSTINNQQLDTLKTLVLGNWILSSDSLTGIATMVKLSKADKQTVSDAIKKQPNQMIVDKGNLAKRFAEIIRGDFNMILLMSSLLVLFFLIFSYGRIELGLITFLPMVISWIWILGIMAIIGIKFNIINIIISTFIFGLGDDYSIFIMDGLLQEYKTGKKNLESYKTSVFLSALTLIIGVGVLIFAKHPALRSIAIITIIGMVTVVIISYTIAPIIFRSMVLKKEKKRIVPFTFKNYLSTIICFGNFTFGAISMTLIGILLRIIPMPQKIKLKIFHFFMQWFSWFCIYGMIHVPKIFSNPSGEKFKKPGIIISNHQSHADIPLMLLLNTQTIAFTNDWVQSNAVYGWLVKLAEFLPVSSGYDFLLEKIRDKVKNGYSILIFPEGTRSEDLKVARFHKGPFYLAEQLKLDIIPVIVHGTGHIMPKKEMYLRTGKIHYKIAGRIAYDDPRFGNNYTERSKAIRRYFSDEYNRYAQEIETPDYFKDNLIKFYLYKGPVLEWYLRIKLRLENNYNIFNDLLPRKGLIADVGCGYGFLAHMLGMVSEERTVKGIDYDQEKILVAANCNAFHNNVSFECSDALSYSFEKSDAFVLSDVLHYLPKNEQQQLIVKCIENLNDKGILLIRDADKDMKKRHRGTRYTEFFSTKFGFNKTGSHHKLFFISQSDIMECLSSYPVDVEVIDNTKLTSNLLYVIRKKS